MNINIPNGNTAVTFELPDGKKVYIQFIGADNKPPFAVDVVRKDVENKTITADAHCFNVGDPKVTSKCTAVSIELS